MTANQQPCTVEPFPPSESVMVPPEKKVQPTTALLLGETQKKGTEINTAVPWQKATIIASFIAGIATFLILLALTLKTILYVDGQFFGHIKVNYYGVEVPTSTKMTMAMATCGQTDFVNAAAVSHYLGLFSALALLVALGHELKSKQYTRNIVAMLIAATTVLLLTMTILLGIVRGFANTFYCNAIEDLELYHIGSCWSLTIAAQFLMVAAGAIYSCARYKHLFFYNAEFEYAGDAGKKNSLSVAAAPEDPNCNSALPWKKATIFGTFTANIAAVLLVVALALKTVLHSEQWFAGTYGRINVTYFEVETDTYIKRMSIGMATCGNTGLVLAAGVCHLLAFFAVLALAVALGHELKTKKYTRSIVTVLFVLSTGLLIVMSALLGYVRAHANNHYCDVIRGLHQFEIGPCWSVSIAAQLLLFFGGVVYACARFRAQRSSCDVSTDNTAAGHLVSIQEVEDDVQQQHATIDYKACSTSA